MSAARDSHVHSRTVVIAVHQHRHRSDHPRALPDHDHEGGPGQAAVRRLALSRRTARPNPDFVLNRPAARGCADPRGRPQLRLRLLARTRAVGAARFRLSRRRQHRDRRHLPRQLAEERLLADRGRRGHFAAGCCEHPGAELDIDLDDGQLDAAERRVGRASRSKPFARHCLLNGVDELGYLRSKLADIERYEAARAMSLSSSP